MRRAHQLASNTNMATVPPARNAACSKTFGCCAEQWLLHYKEHDKCISVPCPLLTYLSSKENVVCNNLLHHNICHLGDLPEADKILAVLLSRPWLPTAFKGALSALWSCRLGSKQPFSIATTTKLVLDAAPAGTWTAENLVPTLQLAAVPTGLVGPGDHLAALSLLLNAYSSAWHPQQLSSAMEACISSIGTSDPAVDVSEQQYQVLEALFKACMPGFKLLPSADNESWYLINQLIPAAVTFGAAPRVVKLLLSKAPEWTPDFLQVPGPPSSESKQITLCPWVRQCPDYTNLYPVIIQAAVERQVIQTLLPHLLYLAQPLQHGVLANCVGGCDTYQRLRAFAEELNRHAGGLAANMDMATAIVTTAVHERNVALLTLLACFQVSFPKCVLLPLIMSLGCGAEDHDAMTLQHALPLADDSWTDKELLEVLLMAARKTDKQSEGSRQKIFEAVCCPDRWSQLTAAAVDAKLPHLQELLYKCHRGCEAASFLYKYHTASLQQKRSVLVPGQLPASKPEQPSAMQATTYDPAAVVSNVQLKSAYAAALAGRACLHQGDPVQVHSLAQLQKLEDQHTELSTELSTESSATAPEANPGFPQLGDRVVQSGTAAAQVSAQMAAAIPNAAEFQQQVQQHDTHVPQTASAAAQTPAADSRLDWSASPDMIGKLLVRGSRDLRQPGAPAAVGGIGVPIDKSTAAEPAELPTKQLASQAGAGQPQHQSMRGASPAVNQLGQLQMNRQNSAAEAAAVLAGLKHATFGAAAPPVLRPIHTALETEAEACVDAAFPPSPLYSSRPKRRVRFADQMASPTPGERFPVPVVQPGNKAVPAASPSRTGALAVAVYQGRAAGKTEVCNTGSVRVQTALHVASTTCSTVSAHEAVRQAEAAAVLRPRISTGPIAHLPLTSVLNLRRASSMNEANEGACVLQQQVAAKSGREPITQLLQANGLVGVGSPQQQHLAGEQQLKRQHAGLDLRRASEQDADVSNGDLMTSKRQKV